jgi:hypothetical protein
MPGIQYMKENLKNIDLGSLMKLIQVEQLLISMVKNFFPMFSMLNRATWKVGQNEKVTKT